MNLDSCIIIAKLVGILNSDIIESAKVDFYNVDCKNGSYSVMIENTKVVEVNVVKINKDLSYNIKAKS